MEEVTEVLREKVDVVTGILTFFDEIFFTIENTRTVFDVMR